MKLSSKIISIGVAALISLAVLFGVNFYAANSVKSASELSVLRAKQLAMTNEMQKAQTQLVLAAMDAIIDKSDGSISPELMEVISKNENTLKNGLKMMAEAADTDTEIKLANDMVSNVNNLVDSIKNGIFNLIIESGHGITDIEENFAQMDDTLDQYGEGLISALKNFKNQVKKRLIDNGNMNEAMQVTDLSLNMQLTVNNLILSAMDSIVDRKEGRIQSKRMVEINQRADYLTTNVIKLASYAKSNQEQQLISQIKTKSPQLIKAVQVDLVTLIEGSAANSNNINQSFTKADGFIDQYDSALNAQLSEYATSVQDEVIEAEVALMNVLGKTRLISIVVFLLALIILAIIITKITISITKPINFALKDMTSSAEQVSGAAGQVSSSSQSLAEGASEQAAALEETSASMEEMTSMTKQNADNATQADNLMREALTVIADADNSMDEMIVSMEDISAASEETSKIVKTIDEIAFQTNLLALNAAVEAARAGEAGAGFAVVADEVRNLALRAADAAKNTSELIEGIVRKVSAGKEIVTKTNSSFKEVAESSTKVGGLVGEISVASNEQSTGFSQISQAITQMDAVTQQNSATAEESAAASEELNAQSGVMMDAVMGLKNMVEGIKTGGKQTRSAETSYRSAPPAPSTPKTTPTLAAPAAAKSVPSKNSRSNVVPEDIIPMGDDDDFEDF